MAEDIPTTLVRDWQNPVFLSNPLQVAIANLCDVVKAHEEASWVFGFSVLQLTPAYFHHPPHKYAVEIKEKMADILIPPQSPQPFFET